LASNGLLTLEEQKIFHDVKKEQNRLGKKGTELIFFFLFLTIGCLMLKNIRRHLLTFVSFVVNQTSFGQFSHFVAGVSVFLPSLIEDLK